MKYTVEDLIKMIDKVGEKLDNCHNTLIKDELISRRENMYYPNPSPETIQFQKRTDHVLTMAQLYHIASMVVNGKYPDGSYSDDECNAWELLKNLHTNPESFK